MKFEAERVLSVLTGTPWLISESGMEQLYAIASRQMSDLKAVAAIAEARHEDTEHTTIRGNVGVLSVIGPIIPRATLFSSISGATSVEKVSTDFQTLLDNDEVDSIMMNFDSPGGAITGVNEFSDMIRNASKPTTAYVGGQAASAAYWWASACDEVVVDATAVLGSIGVVACVPSKADENKLDITNTASPNKRVDLSTESGQAILVSELDALANVFIGQVARSRGVTTKQVEEDFGKGGVLVGQGAVDAGMADRLGSYEGLIAELQNKKTTIGGSIMDYAVLTEELLTANRSDLVSTFQAQGAASVSASLGEKDEALKTLQAENEQLKADDAKNSDRLVALERADAIRAEKELATTVASTVSDRLVASKLPERLHSKVSASISAEAFIVEGALDATAFASHVDTEVSDWEASLGDSIQGISMRSSDVPAASSGADDAIVARLLGEDCE